MFNTVVDEFGSGPKFNNSALVLPSDFHINSKTYKDKTAYIDLQPSFNKLSPSDRIFMYWSYGVHTYRYEFY